jgi:uncharacterized BrkB/YihY/UPF0761 family membrane protein
MNKFNNILVKGFHERQKQESIKEFKNILNGIVSSEKVKKNHKKTIIRGLKNLILFLIRLITISCILLIFIVIAIYIFVPDQRIVITDVITKYGNVLAERLKVLFRR